MIALQGIISGLQGAASLTKGFLELKTMAEVQGKVIELQAAIMSAQGSALAAQSDQAAMIQRIRDLEEEVARIKAWEEAKQRYELTSPIEGVFVYALKRESSTTEQPHWICTKCYEDSRKSILQIVPAPQRRAAIKCFHCDSVVEINAPVEWLVKTHNLSLR